MIDREILANAIDKAIANGYKTDALHNYIRTRHRNSVEVQLLDSYVTIFTHDFAKAFWGEDEMAVVKAGNHMIQRWQFHLQNMVLEENPIKYLEKFL